MFCKKHEVEISGCSKWGGSDPQETCFKCIEKEPSGDSDEKTHADGQGDQLPLVKHGYSAIKHRSKGVILMSTKRFLPHLGEREGSYGK